MENYQTSSHRHFDIKFCLMWVIEYRWVAPVTLQPGSTRSLSGIQACFLGVVVPIRGGERGAIGGLSPGVVDGFL